MSLKDAFKMALSLKTRPMTYHHLPTDLEFSVDVSSSNYSRNAEVVQGTVTPSREYVIDIDKFTEQGITPAIGDKLIDPTLGVFTVKNPIEMNGLNEIIGYRLRVD